MAYPSARTVFAELVGPRLREIRERKGLSIADVAEWADVSPTFVSQVETGVQVPRGDSLVRVMAILGATLEDVAADYYDLYRERGEKVRALRMDTDPSKLLGRRATTPADAPAAAGNLDRRGSRRSSTRSSDSTAARTKRATSTGSKQRKDRSGRTGREGGI